MTGRGWALLAAAVVSMATGRVLGLEDVFVIGAGMLLTLAAGAAYVEAVRPRLTATRRVLPARVHAGTSSRVELSLVNQSSRRSPVLAVRDPFDGGTRWARFLVAPLAPGEVGRAAYRLPTDQRGVFDLGPLEVGVSDPFGLIAASVEAAPRTRLTVYPRIDQVAPPPSSHGDDPLAGADHPRAFTGGGEDFYALRPYVRGDDLRRVHWPSTAKTDDLMIRQDEMPWQSRSTLLLDNRVSVCPPPALEVIVSAAASIAVVSARHDGLQRLLTANGFDSRSAGGTNHVEMILEHLAGLRSAPGELLPVLGGLRRSRSGGALVVLTTALAHTSDFEAMVALNNRFSCVMLVLVEPSAWGEAAPPRSVPARLRVVRVEAGHPFAAAWSAAVGPAAAIGAKSGRGWRP
jgi:uncharacterized protein (DUF58 family)